MNGENQAQPLITPDRQGKKPTDDNHTTDTTNVAKSAPPFSQKALRTYESDVADVLARKNISTTRIALEENRRNSGEDRIGSSTEEQKEDESSPEDRRARTKKMLLGAGGLIFILGGIIGGYYLYSLSPLSHTRASNQVQQTAPVSMVPADSHVIIQTDNMSSSAILKSVRNEMAKPQPADTIKEIALVQTKNDQRFRVSATDMIKTMNIGMPDILNRALGNNWMLGVYAAGPREGKHVFVVASIDYFQNAFAGILQWEDVMADDLKQYLYEQAPAGISSAGSLPIASSTDTTATGTPIPSPYTIIRGKFTDRIVQNKDVREFIVNGDSILLYSFINNTKLVVTDSESTLTEILKRLEQNDFMR